MFVDRIGTSPRSVAEDEEGLILTAGDVVSFFRGTEAPGEGWNGLGFDDSDWESGPLGIGYGDFDDETILEDMRCRLAEGEGDERECTEGGYLSFFVRAGFVAPEIPDVQRLVLASHRVSRSRDAGLEPVEVRAHGIPASSQEPGLHESSHALLELHVPFLGRAVQTGRPFAFSHPDRAARSRRDGEAGRLTFTAGGTRRSHNPRSTHIPYLTQALRCRETGS